MIKGWEHLKFWKHELPKVQEFFNHHQGMKNRIFPPDTMTYRALELTPFDEVKCVILGQDPYHTKGVAMGLAFSVFPHVSPLPPSLKNILREYEADLGYPFPKCGDLTPWAEAGCLLLNPILTVEEGRPLSHEGLGWEKLAYEILRKLSEEKNGIAFIFWGKKAQEFMGAVDADRHLVLASPHPSPFSARTGFLGSRPFTTVNRYLRDTGKKELDWRLR